jgi:hypothetical protein
MRDFFPAEHLRQGLDLSWIRGLDRAPASLQHLDIKESQPCQMLHYRARCEFLLSQQRRLVLTDMFQAQLIRRPMEVWANCSTTWM